MTAGTYTSDMLIYDVLQSRPGVAEIFARHGLSCAHCMAAEMETLSSVATMHELPVEALLDDLNALAAQEGE